ncbi:hypothetical protein HIMB11_02023 [Rhodobacteraceae bacterium HIMB11]|nr:hypothetical protein HIMB11_02023 [Rhodobacteraceae bacterium HIMB11]
MLLGKCFARLGYGFIWLLVSMTGIATAGCTDSIVEIKSAHAHIKLNVEVADSAEERAIGLMHRENMPYNGGMWFIYETPRTVAFWMRSTLIPLDMIFVDQHGEVQKIHMNARPLDETPIHGGDNIQFVLEVNAGLSERYGLGAGDFIRHPSIKQDPVWPCQK